jgi:hypothetical protein
MYDSSRIIAIHLGDITLFRPCFCACFCSSFGNNQNILPVVATGVHTCCTSLRLSSARRRLASSHALSSATSLRTVRAPPFFDSNLVPSNNSSIEILNSQEDEDSLDLQDFYARLELQPMERRLKTKNVIHKIFFDELPFSRHTTHSILLLLLSKHLLLYSSIIN